MKKRLWIIGLIAVLVVSLFVSLSRNVPYIVAAKEHAAFKAENNALGAAINDLLQIAAPDIAHSCDTYDQGYWRNEAHCIAFVAYGYQATAQPGGREAAIKRAKALESILRQRDWTNDRLQDPNQTIEATLPKIDLPAFTLRSLPMHKNIGPVSCNLNIEAGGSVKDPIVTVNRFSCSQHITYYFPHLTREQHFLV